MAKEVTLVKGDEYKTGYVGFSWATFFFGFICPAIRKDWKWMFIMWGVLYIFPYMLTGLIFALLKAVGAINPYDLGTVIILPIVLTVLFYYIMVTWMAFIYNKAYTKKFIAQDFRPVNDASAYLLQNAKITVNDTVANNNVDASSDLRQNFRASKAAELKTPSDMVKEAFALLERSDFGKAEKLLEQALKLNPNNSNAYIGALMAEQKCRNVSELVNSKIILEDDELFQKALELANPKSKQILEKYIQVNRINRSKKI